MGKPKAYLYTNGSNRLPLWMLNAEWDMTIKAVVTSFLGDDMTGVEPMAVGTDTLLVSTPERAILECLNLSDASSNLLDIYYVMESLTTLRPKLLQTLFFFVIGRLISLRILRRQSSLTSSSSAPKKSLPCLAACAIYLSTSIPIRTLTFPMLSRKGRSEKYPDARRNPTTASKFLI